MLSYLWLLAALLLLVAFALHRRSLRHQTQQFVTFQESGLSEKAASFLRARSRRAWKGVLKRLTTEQLATLLETSVSSRSVVPGLLLSRLLLSLSSARLAEALRECSFPAQERIIRVLQELKPRKLASVLLLLTPQFLLPVLDSVPGLLSVLSDRKATVLVEAASTPAEAVELLLYLPFAQQVAVMERLLAAHAAEVVAQMKQTYPSLLAQIEDRMSAGKLADILSRSTTAVEEKKPGKLAAVVSKTQAVNAWLDRHFGVWLLLRLPAFITSFLFFLAVMSLLTIYLLGGVGVLNLDTLHLGPLTFLWRAFLSDPGTGSAVCTGGLSMVVARFIVPLTKPLAADKKRMARLPRRGRRLWYAMLSLPYFGFSLGIASIWLGFHLAGALLHSLYVYPATALVVTAVYSWLQQPPGAALYAVRQVFVFGSATAEEKQKARADLSGALTVHPRLFGAFGPQLFLQRRFYIKGVPLVLGSALALFFTFGLLLLGGYASGPHPAGWQVGSVLVASTVAGVLIGWFGCFLSSLVVWANSYGFPRSLDEWAAVNKTAFAAMLGSSIGPSSQAIGFLMSWLLRNGAGAVVALGLYVFWGHLSGDLLSLIVVLTQAKQMSQRSRED